MSIYSATFDSNSAAWSIYEEYNRYFLKLQQNYANELLKYKGHLLLNDIYDMLGLPKTEAGKFVGWLYRPGDTTRDNFIDFNLVEAFENSSDLIYPLDFNVDGDISEEAFNE